MLAFIANSSIKYIFDIAFKTKCIDLNIAIFASKSCMNSVHITAMDFKLETLKTFRLMHCSLLRMLSRKDNFERIQPQTIKAILLREHRRHRPFGNRDVLHCL